MLNLFIYFIMSSMLNLDNMSIKSNDNNKQIVTKISEESVSLSEEDKKNLLDSLKKEKEDRERTRENK